VSPSTPDREPAVSAPVGQPDPGPRDAVSPGDPAQAAFPWQSAAESDAGSKAVDGVPGNRREEGQGAAAGQGQAIPASRRVRIAPRTGALGRAVVADATAPGADLAAGLNADQRRAVTHGEGPLLVVAGPGTGKTQVITRRIAWLIATRRARPSEILALTFTDRAADEMQGRVDELVPYGFIDTTISTFHAFGDRLVREFAFELGIPGDARVLSRPETVLFLRDRVFDLGLDLYRPLGEPTRFLEGLASHFSRCKDEDISPEAYLAHAERLAREAGLEETAADTDPHGTIEPGGPLAPSGARSSPGPDEGLAALPRDEDQAAQEEEARRALEVARAFGRYQSLMAEAGSIDFGDQVALALRLLRESPAARREIRERYRYILVDEFQDTNRSQWELVALLAEPRRNLMVVGDDDQAIYRFRGAAIENILGFRRRFPRSRRIVLRRNYRSTSSILEASHRLVRCNDPERLEVAERISKVLVPTRRSTPDVPVRHAAFATGAEEADWIASEIAGRLAAGARPGDHAVLIRSNAEADPILRSLNVAGIAWRFSGATGLYGRPEVRELLAFLRAIADLGSTVDVYAVATAAPYELGGTDLTTILARSRRLNRNLWDALVEVVEQPRLLRLSTGTREAVARLVTDLRRYSELAHERPAGEVLYAFLRDSGRLARLAAEDSVASVEALRNVARFFELVRSRSALLPDPRAVFLARHLQALVEAGDDPATADLDPAEDAVAVLTIHKAKGLEFPVVYVAGLVEGRLPSTGRRSALRLPDALFGLATDDTESHVREERRLCYVAMTRARDELVLTSAADYGGRRTRRASRFVSEALDMPADRLGVPAAPLGALAQVASLGQAEDTATGRSAIATGRGTSVPGAAAAAVASRDRAQARTGPLALSFYQVDDYLACPLRYRYRHVLGIPVATHHSIVYGSALHQAVQEFHRVQMRGQVPDVDAVLAAFERAWTNEGFLSREHEEARFRAGEDALRRFHSSQTRPGAGVPSSVEREFSFSLDGNTVRGRWDRMDVEPSPDGVADRVTITDYKSSDVRDRETANRRARESLQLSIYALAYRAMAGRVPDAVRLHFLDSGVVGEASIDDRRLEKARGLVCRAGEGIRAGTFAATPERFACTYCPFRVICPSSVAR
jgi:DNA helicase-2/ATP-dependent DNA helicase PcrA